MCDAIHSFSHRHKSFHAQKNVGGQFWEKCLKVDFFLEQGADFSLNYYRFFVT